MPDQYKQYESIVDESSLEASPPTTPTSEILELENQPPGSGPMSQSMTLSSSGPVTQSVVSGIRQANSHRNSQLAMKVKQEVTSEMTTTTTNDNCKYQSYDRFRCDTNNNSNKNNSNCNNSSNVSHKTTIAKQILSVIRNDDFEELLIILRSKPDLNVFINGQTALHYCLLLGRDVSWCRQLVLNGANPNLSNHDGWHPLHLAASYGHKEIMSYLINCNNNKEMTADVI